MDDKKPSTSDILAKIRAQKSAAAAQAASPSESTPPVEAPAESVAASAEAAPVTPSAPAAAGAPAAKPGGTRDILAAIRAQGGKGAAAAPAKPGAGGAAKPAAKPAAAAKPAEPAGALPSVADMVRAARKGAPVESAEKAKSAPVSAPPMPAKPVPKKGAAATPDPVRRGMSGIVTVAAFSLGFFLVGGLIGSPILIGLGIVVWGALMSPFVAAWASVAAVTGIATLGTARFMFPNVLVEPPSKFKVGPASDYPLNAVSNKWKDQFGIWIVHTDQYEGKNLIYALASVCTHLGCTPSWLDGEQKFKCPCHGSGFYITGVNFEGPAPRPLERVGLRIAEDGLLEVDKSLKFQEEMGQWTDATSFVEVV